MAFISAGGFLDQVQHLQRKGGELADLLFSLPARRVLRHGVPPTHRAGTVSDPAPQVQRAQPKADRRDVEQERIDDQPRAQAQRLRGRPVPHSWERGTNENTNGLIRQYLPKKSCFKDLTQRQCNVIEQELNNRPRKVLGFDTPNEAEAEECCT